MENRRHRVRAALNWFNLSTPVGLLVARSCCGRVRHGPHGLWLADGYRFRYPNGSAFTLGDVVMTASPSLDELCRQRPGLLVHEENHALQYACFGGLLMLPAYAVAAGWSMLRTGDVGLANWFEQDADLVLGGYVVAGSGERDDGDGDRARRAQGSRSADRSWRRPARTLSRRPSREGAWARATGSSMSSLRRRW